MRHDAQLDLRVVGTGDHAAGRSHKGFAHATAFGGFNGYVLQVGFIARQAPCDSYCLRVMRVHAAGARVRQLRQLVGVSAFELGQAAVLQNFGRQRIVFSEFFQHFFVGTGCAGGGFFDHGQTQLGEENLTDLLGRTQVKSLAGQGVGLGFELHNAGAQLGALRSQHGRVYQHAISFDAVQTFAGLDFQIVNKQQLGIGLQHWPQQAVHGQGLLGVFAGVLAGLRNIDLVELDLAGTFAAQVFKADAAASQVALSQAGQTMRFVDLQHIALQHGVVAIALHLNAVVREHMAVVFDVLTQLGTGGVLQPGLEPRQHLGQRQLLGCARVVVRQRNVSGCSGFHAQAQPHHPGLHRIDRGRLRVHGHQLGALDLGQQGIEGRPAQDGVAMHIDSMNSCWGWCQVGLVKQAQRVAGCVGPGLSLAGRRTGRLSRRVGMLQTFDQPLEAEAQVKSLQRFGLLRPQGDLVQRR